MKRILLNLHSFFSVLLLSAAFVACNNDDTDVQTNNLPIVLTTGDMAKVTSIGDQLPAKQEIGVFFSENPTTDPASGKTYDPNLKYVADGNGGLSGVIQYYPDNNNGVTISAYHPYNDDATDEYVFTVNADQTTDENVYNSDLLYCDEFAQAKSQNAINIRLNHKLSQVSLVLTSGDNTPDLTDAQITLLGVNTSVTFNRKTGTVSIPANPQDVKLNKDGNGGIIVPQTIPSGTKLAKITLKNGTEMFYTTSSNLTLTENKKHTITVKVNRTETFGMGTEVGEWGEGGTSGGEANEDNSGKLLPLKIDHFRLFGNSHIQYTFTYDSQNRVSKFEWLHQRGINNIDSLSAYWIPIYDTQGKLIGQEEYQRLPGDSFISLTEKYTYDYSISNQVQVTHVYKYSGQLITSYSTIYVNDKGRISESHYKELENGVPVDRIYVYRYDENDNYANRIYDDKTNPLTHVNLPMWFFQAHDPQTLPSSGLFPGKNNQISSVHNDPETDQIVDREYNEWGYPTKMSYFNTELNRENYVTYTYKKWDE